ncbi:hypothetical protein GIW05_00155 [Pseudomonas syringae]|uniref:hypothetical protein n=1 Tax=Pseudomonas syringae TaxID=317 RepID=UPI001F4056A9|nr:hypothetical protein [Pseudomonas syringae]MCF5381933.1 hypothetical protein [Pseudomonas syringae]MCF5423813.1 hypothetical protein [Pseudomonas syringae]MCF5455004.1 hypothetical protein [Pseudomonas syringae]MCF5459558.1 hypothetical protein [Pseudomonas syringae]
MSINTAQLSKAFDQAVSGNEGLILIEHHNMGYADDVIARARDGGQQARLKVVTFESPLESATYNPLVNLSVRAALEQAALRDPSSREEFRSDIGAFALLALMLTLRLQPGGPAYHLKDMIVLLSDLDMWFEYANRIQPQESPDHKAGSAWVYNYMRNWWREDEQLWDYNTYKRLTQGLLARLSGFAHAESSMIVNTYAPDVDLARSIELGEIVVFKLSGIYGEYARGFFDRLLMLDLDSAVFAQNNAPESSLLWTLERDEGVQRAFPNTTIIRVLSDINVSTGMATHDNQSANKLSDSKGDSGAWENFLKRSRPPLHV